MAVESKLLFHPEVMRQQVRSFVLLGHVSAWQPKLQHWASLISSGRAGVIPQLDLQIQFRFSRKNLADPVTPFVYT
jgi:hypothetical protein